MGEIRYVGVMGKPAVNMTDSGEVAAALAARLDARLENSDPELYTLLRMLISENAAIKAAVSQLHQELRSAHALADQDPLCAVMNRRAFHRELKREIARSTRHERDLSILFIDLDKFKSINDTQGHEAGDRVLVAMADTLLAAVRKTDIVARLGGDEFAILLIETGAENARLCAEGLKERVDSRQLGITASVGVASWSLGQTADALIAAADKAMFQDKHH